MSDPKTVVLDVVYDGSIVGVTEPLPGPQGPAGPVGPAGPQGPAGPTSGAGIPAPARGVVYSNGSGGASTATQIRVTGTNDLRVTGAADGTGSYGRMWASGIDVDVGAVSPSGSALARVSGAGDANFAAKVGALLGTLGANTRQALLSLESGGNRYVQAFADGTRGQIRVSHAPAADDEVVRRIDTRLAARSRAVRVEPGTATPEIAVRCAADEVVTGGGASWGAGSAARTWIAASAPTDAADGWTARGMNNAASALVFRVHAICRKRLGGVSVVESREGEE